MANKKPEFFFSALPFRAAGDKRITAADFRVLMAIAAHDRLNQNGRGCEASNPRLAMLSNSDLKALSRSISNLILCGYVTRKPNLKDRRQNVLTVTYNDFDYAYFAAGGGGIGSASATKVGCKSATEQEGFRPGTHPLAAGFGGGIGDEAASILQQIGSKVQKKDEESQEDASPNIFCETVINPDESEKKFSEAAPFGDRALERVPSRSLGATLGMIERQMKHKRGVMPLSEIVQYRDWIFQRLDRDDPPHESKEYHWASRLLGELEEWAEAFENRGVGNGSA